MPDKEARKALKEALRAQIEFYFSDSNIVRDKFLRSKVMEDPQGFVDLSLIASFKKVQALTLEMKQVQRALKHSELLELSSDGLRVRRRAPVPSQLNTDDRTLFVGQLSGDYDHAMLSSFFARYGTVTLVSLPRFRLTREFKGIGFVEFSDAASMEKALQSKRASKRGWTLKSKRDWLAGKEQSRAVKRERNEAAASGGLVHGLIVRAAHLPELSFAETRNLLKIASPPAYVEYPSEDDAHAAIVRYATPEAAQRAVQFFEENRQEHSEGVVVLSLLSGEEERQYWEKLRELRAKRRK